MFFLFFFLMLLTVYLAFLMFCIRKIRYDQKHIPQTMGKHFLSTKEMQQHVIPQGLWPPEAGPRLWPGGLLLGAGGCRLPAANPPAGGAAHPCHGPRHAVSRNDVTQPQPLILHQCQPGGQQGGRHHRPHHPLQQTGEGVRQRHGGHSVYNLYDDIVTYRYSHY